MWKLPINFITLHYAWIIITGLLALVVIYPYGNVSAIDAWFFGASGSTESGLNTVDVKDLKIYQQLYIYVIPIITNLGFINIVVVAVRLRWFEKRFKVVARSCPKPNHTRDIEAQITAIVAERSDNRNAETEPAELNAATDKADEPVEFISGPRITFDQNVKKPRSDSTLYIPPPRERDDGHPFVDKNNIASGDEDDDDDAIKPAGPSGLTRRHVYRHDDEHSISRSKSVDQVAASLFVIGNTRIASPRQSTSSSRWADLPYLSKQVTLGRNSNFYGLSSQDRERLGGVEYRALKLLLKIVSGYFVGLHLFGVLCLLPWIHRSAAKYTDWLEECAQDKTWWAFYSAQTMVNNLGFTLTPDSMVTFRDATWPMLATTFLAYAGETFYPVFMRLIISTMSKLTPKQSSMKETLQFLLDHPRRCCMLLFPSRPTWILCGILVVMNFVDVLLIIALDLDNPAVNDLPMGPRILSALFQAASSRHTGTSTFNLAQVNPAVQFSLLVMMYIAVFPIAISIRASNTYEERSLGVYEQELTPDESNGKSYVLMHIRNQLSFDLWYIFLGTFFICIAESAKIADINEPAFSVFSVFTNVGLSLGHPAVMTSLSGQFTTISKVVVCAMMIRGRHRGLPYAIDRAVLLPGEREHQGSRGR
ncbi:cation transport protein-domain-containing protein [Dichotomopilus funicola]|uniref:Cation transport protein-domain-containing protein n=1 Tax=Dichotomopilus funicola TaxID=1934379 RepID=A0AAN6ZLZ7_9PEZI|nr:cation transport protein-domain-containing protein [Dichotomopilus funicola]